MQTGDLLLFSEFPTNCCCRCFTSLVKCCTDSKYSHVALLLRDPCGKKGLFVWESSFHPGSGPDPLDGKSNKFGVQVTPLRHYLDHYPGKCRVFLRRRLKKGFSDAFINTVRETVHDKPYDVFPQDWVEALLRTGPPATAQRFWCSAFVAYVLKRGNDIDVKDWSGCRAQDFSASCKDPPFKWVTTYLREEEIDG